jgi:hypothetical protein
MAEALAPDRAAIAGMGAGAAGAVVGVFA